MPKVLVGGGLAVREHGCTGRVCILRYGSDVEKPGFRGILESNYFILNFDVAVVGAVELEVPTELCHGNADANNFVDRRDGKGGDVLDRDEIARDSVVVDGGCRNATVTHMCSGGFADAENRGVVGRARFS